MAEYLLIDNWGRVRGTKALTDLMADRLEDRGWQVIPAGEAEAIKAQAIKFQG